MLFFTCKRLIYIFHFIASYYTYLYHLFVFQFNYIEDNNEKARVLSEVATFWMSCFVQCIAKHMHMNVYVRD